jgi:hypothetical protein
MAQLQLTTSNTAIQRNGSLILKVEDGVAVQLDSKKPLRIAIKEAKPIWEVQVNILILSTTMMACSEIIQTITSKTGLWYISNIALVLVIKVIEKNLSNIRILVSILEDIM